MQDTISPYGRSTIYHTKKSVYTEWRDISVLNQPEENRFKDIDTYSATLQIGNKS